MTENRETVGEEEKNDEKYLILIRNFTKELYCTKQSFRHSISNIVCKIARVTNERACIEAKKATEV